MHCSPTYGRSDGRTVGRTDGRTERKTRVIEGAPLLKKKEGKKCQNCLFLFHFVHGEIQVSKYYVLYTLISRISIHYGIEHVLLLNCKNDLPTGPDTELFRGGGQKIRKCARSARNFPSPLTNFVPPPSK